MTRLTHEHQHYDTIVIGAGVAGLACASRLLQYAKYQRPGNLLVLEARHRIGGRVNAVHVNGSHNPPVRLDEGANWIHGIGTGEKPNPLMSILPHKRYRELAGAVVFKAPEASAAPSHEGDVSRAIVPEIAGPLLGGVFGLLDELHKVAPASDPAAAKETTLLHSIGASDTLTKIEAQLPDQYHRTLRLMPQFVENMEAGPLAASSAEHEKGRAGLGLLEFAIDDFEGEQVFLQDGYSAIVDELAKDLVNSDQIKLGCEVRTIHHDESNVNVVETMSGRFTADRIVCTLPLGVLQHRLSQSGHEVPLFKSPLPTRITKAIDSLGFGTLDKIFLVYDKAWWLEEPYASRYSDKVVNLMESEATSSPDGGQAVPTAPDSFMGFTEELPGLIVGPDGKVEAGSRLLSCINLHALTGYFVLSTFVSCSNAVRVESMSDAEAGGIVHRALTQWLGVEPPKASAVHVTRWAQDEYSRGSYSHMIAGVSMTEHRETFQTPIVNALGAEVRFAGEHTSRNHFATVHGALISGYREADAILASMGPS
ncbi:hypothetical protein B0A48_06058 [Cryoendolithus antarcticus]|uniref:Amine oxidase domain-containing protein n=1 Tax=Cryoendolithus antarcticus TaxID=1507870 RepID=A0A1V8TCQ5_9PEZI|nr:hypothetical protein B0A48_06058 [Cryoendolithus antarcticus]